MLITGFEGRILTLIREIEDMDNVRTQSGKQVLGLVIAIAVTVGVVLGWVIGTSPDAQHISVFGTVLFHPTPTSMAFYGGTAAAIGLTVVFVIVTLLSRFDDASI